MGYNSLANFYIEKKIGRGQFSEVYRAKYLLDNTAVALKKVQVSWLLTLDGVPTRDHENVTPRFCPEVSLWAELKLLCNFVRCSRGKKKKSQSAFFINEGPRGAEARNAGGWSTK